MKEYIRPEIENRNLVQPAFYFVTFLHLPTMDRKPAGDGHDFTFTGDFLPKLDKIKIWNLVL